MSYSYKECTNLKEGDVFYEATAGMNVRMTVLLAPHVVCLRDGTRQAHWKSMDDQGVQHHHMITEGMEHYGPRLYAEPAYFMKASQ